LISHRGLLLSGLGRLCLAYVPWVRAFACTPVIPAVPYMPTELAGCSVGPGISRGARKLIRTSWVIKKIYIYIWYRIKQFGIKICMCLAWQWYQRAYPSTKPTFFCLHGSRYLEDFHMFIKTKQSYKNKRSVLNFLYRWRIYYVFHSWQVFFLLLELTVYHSHICFHILIATKSCIVVKSSLFLWIV